MKVLKRKILLSLSLPVDFFKLSEGFLYRPYSFFYEILKDYKKGSIRSAMGELCQSGEVDKIIRNGVPFFRLTAMGRERLLNFFPIWLGQKRVWDRIWRICLLDPGKFELSQLRKLRFQLRKMGFRRFSKGVYLTPMPISERLKNFLVEEKFTGGVTVIESRRLLIGDDKVLAAKIWRLDELFKKYTAFINQCKSLLKRIDGKKRRINSSKNKFNKLFNDYFLLLSSDPGLPKKLLPLDWPGELAREIFLRLSERFGTAFKP